MAKQKAAERQDGAGGTVYLRHTQSGHSYITEHRTWDANLFISTQFQSNAEVNAKGTGAVILEECTEGDYEEFRRVSRNKA